jgi:enoyl-CoA hydratase/carnithine racemase
MGSLVGYAVDGGVAVVSMQRSEKRNALDPEMFPELGEAADAAGADDEVGAVLVRGEHGVFSAGIDLDVVGRLASVESAMSEVAELQAAFTRFGEMDKPTIAGIEGHCYGAAAQLAAACHLRAVAPSAEIAVMEARWGLVPDLGGTYRLSRLLGLGRATELAATGRIVGHDQALAIGLADVSLGAAGPGAQALAYAQRLASGPAAVRKLPRLLRENLDRSREAALAAEADAQTACLASTDFREAIRARQEGRPATFVGR